MKKAMFFENAKLLYDKFGIVPLMYGSLGLEYITNKIYKQQFIRFYLIKNPARNNLRDYISRFE